MAERAHPEDPGFQNTPYGRYLEARYTACVPFIANKRVLDVPCGTGWGTSLLTGCASVAALDVDVPSVHYGAQHFRGISFIAGDMRALPFADHRFDVVVCLEGIEHVLRSTAAAFLAEARRVMDPAGTFIATVPLLRNGKHSGNPYHSYEFEEAEIRSLLEQHFVLDECECIDDETGPVIRSVGRPRQKPAPAPAPAKITPVHVRALHWLRTMRDRGGFRFSGRSGPSLFPTAAALLILEGLNALDSTPERQDCIDYIRSCQDPVTGLFLDPLIEKYPVTSTVHDRSYLEHTFTYWALQALDAAATPALHPLRFLGALSPESATQWLEGLDWGNPWLESNRVMYLLASLVYRAEVQKDATAPAVYHAVLDWLDSAQESDTGLWGVRRGVSMLNAVAGAYHFLPFYEYVNRPICGLRQMADACLALQREDGLFGAQPGGGACEDLDAVFILSSVARRMKYRAGEIRRSLIRAFWALWNLQNEDGGFPYAKRETGEVYHYSSWSPLEAERRQSDVFATWFRLSAMSAIRSLYPEDLPDLGKWRFRRWPALGYSSAGSFGCPEAIADLWVRPFRQAAQLSVGVPPAVTVVIPCYNLGTYLHEAIQSVLDQEGEAAEIIVVDDGSTDPFTFWYVRQLHAPRARVILAPNSGVATARNIGIQAAAGQYICCLDADDRLRPDYLAKAKTALDADPELGFVSCYYTTFDGESSTYRYRNCRFPDLLARNEAVVSSVFRKEAWERAGGYCSDLTGMHDWDFWIGILEAGYRAAVLPEVLFEYRKRADSMYTVTSRPENFARLTAKIQQRHKAAYDRWAAEVIQLKTRHFVELLQARELEARAARVAGEAAAKATENWKSTADRLEEAKNWFRGQAEAWEKAAVQQRAYIEQLEAAKSDPRLGQLECETERLRAQVADLEGIGGSQGSLIGIFRAAGMAGHSGPATLKNLWLWRRVMRSTRAREVWAAHFDPLWYLKAYPDVRRSGIEPALHYLLSGAREGRRPSERFDGDDYLRLNPDVRNAGLNPLVHYALFGYDERRTSGSSGGEQI